MQPSGFDGSTTRPVQRFPLADAEHGKQLVVVEVRRRRVSFYILGVGDEYHEQRGGLTDLHDRARLEEPPNDAVGEV